MEMHRAAGRPGGARAVASPRWARAGVRILGSVVVAVPLIVLGAAAPASAQTEPPNVLGLPLDEAITIVQRHWYPDSGVVPQVFWTPDIPETVSRDAVFVLDVSDIFYLEDSDDANPSASITYVVGTVVPDLTGLTEDEANGIVSDLGFSLEGAGDPAGVVVGQSPQPGTQSPFESTVFATFEVPLPKTAYVPDLIGLSESAAATAVEDAGLTLEVTSRTGGVPFQVAAQSPGAGAELALGAPVEVELTGTRRTVEVPDLTGATAELAEQTLADLSLTLRVDPNGDGRNGVAARQDPAPGSQVDPGSVITVAFAVPIAPPDEDGGFPWVPVGVGAGAFVLAAGAVAMMSHERMRTRRPEPRPVRFRAQPDKRPSVSTQHAPDSRGGADVAIAIRPHPSAGTTVLEEMP